MKKLFVLGLLFFFGLSSILSAADFEAIMDSSNGTSGYCWKDSSATEVGRIDSDGNLVIRGGMRLDAAGVKCTTAELLIIDGKVGIGTNNPVLRLEVVGGESRIEQQPWQVPVLLNGWINYEGGYSTAAYFKDSLGLVHLKGVIKSGALSAAAFNLPPGCRPMETLGFCAFKSGGTGKVNVTPAGDIYMDVTCSTDYTYLDGIIFRAEQ
ncbi:MAG: hypothetical protein PHQ23_15170 [Candidatus Wallbacteria bacterium]|nr:hypothetical protein [Candidatus Wallbacteria bacterium]